MPYRLDYWGAATAEIAARMRETAHAEAEPSPFTDSPALKRAQPHDWITRDVYERQLDALDADYLMELLDNTGDEAMSLIRDFLDGLADTAAEAIRDVREKVVEQGWFGRTTGAQEIGNNRLGEISASLNTIGERMDGVEKIAVGVEQSNQSLQTIAERFAPAREAAQTMEPGRSIGERMQMIEPQSQERGQSHEHDLER